MFIHTSNIWIFASHFQKKTQNSFPYSKIYGLGFANYAILEVFFYIILITSFEIECYF